LILATERKNRSNTGIPDGWVTRYLLVHRSRLTSSTQGWQFAADTEPDPQVQSRQAGSA